MNKVENIETKVNSNKKRVSDNDGIDRKKRNKKYKNIKQDEKPIGIVECPLCECNDPLVVVEYIYLHRKYYFTCNQCTLVFVHSKYHVTNEKEKERYEHHHNSPLDQKYKDFLKPAIDKLLPLLKDTMEKSQKTKEDLVGLDYGCGPTPTLSVMFKELGYQMENYDPYFQPNETVQSIETLKDKPSQILEKRFDFITCTEAIEHFNKPLQDLRKLLDYGLLMDNGCLLIMTQLLKNDEMFKNWFYPRDQTHICFFRKSTFEWIAKKFQREVTIFEEENIIIIKNTEKSSIK
ncbi:hypothetical protein DLAC_05420 [Tieghemostelium lacteum]|uniref:Uncharacterized protein n=1 Tax=Tieghemostelium lacteum TaxID=361077 RepID=A0A151ZFU2_TIELA|nr:hypothetical protein DLAC_05420 [Tieghemostelium lacteum]|eukprot:KYQ92836.1 hypothetical protein DLAC_05420 [Tieghemostelium lacteum]